MMRPRASGSAGVDAPAFDRTKRSVGALSPTDVALFPTSPCAAEGSVMEESHTPGALSLGGGPGWSE